MTKTYLPETRVEKYRIDAENYLWDISLNDDGILSYELGEEGEADNFSPEYTATCEETQAIVAALEAAGFEKVEWMEWTYL
jgi:hypothetical protein